LSPWRSLIGGMSNVILSSWSICRVTRKGIVANVCVSAVVRFRSRVLSPKPNVERRYKLWTTRHRTIAETFCWRFGRYSVPLVFFSVPMILFSLGCKNHIPIGRKKVKKKSPILSLSPASLLFSIDRMVRPGNEKT
jgi:hypothetical protein